MRGMRRQFSVMSYDGGLCDVDRSMLVVNRTQYTCCCEFVEFFMVCRGSASATSWCICIGEAVPVKHAGCLGMNVKMTCSRRQLCFVLVNRLDAVCCYSWCQ